MMCESVWAVDWALDVLFCFTNQTPELNMISITERVIINLAVLENADVVFDQISSHPSMAIAVPASAGCK